MNILSLPVLSFILLVASPALQTAEADSSVEIFELDGDGEFAPLFYMDQAEDLTENIRITEIDGQEYCMTFSNISRRRIYVNIYEGDAPDREKLLFTSDAEMTQLYGSETAMQIVFADDAAFLDTFTAMLISRDSFDTVHVEMYPEIISSPEEEDDDDMNSEPGDYFEEEDDSLDFDALEYDPEAVVIWDEVRADNPDELQYITLTRRVNSGVDLEWSYEIEPEGILETVIDSVTYDNDYEDGVGGIHRWRFRAAADGEVTITLKCTGIYEEEYVYCYEITDGMAHEK